jgi:hypothetical protein
MSVNASYYKKYCLLGCDAVQSDASSQTFTRNIPFPFLGLKNTPGQQLARSIEKAERLLRNVGKLYYTTWRCITEDGVLHNHCRESPKFVCLSSIQRKVKILRG